MLKTLDTVEKIKVMAYITAFEDSKSVINCITSLQNQSFPIDKILIVDNSHNQPISVVDCQNIGENIIIKYHPENIGVGGGLQLALDFAKAEKYDFLWTFDQDSIPTDNCLEILLETYFKLSQNQYQIGIIAPTAIDSRTNSVVEGAMFEGYRFMGLKHNYEVDTYECDSPITSGSLIPIHNTKSNSPQLANLFIDGVDFELGMQLKQKGFHNLIVTSAIMHHNFGNPTTVFFFNEKKNIQLYSAFRYYYIFRNHTFLEFYYAKYYAKKWYLFLVCIWRIKLTFSTILHIQWYDNEGQYQKITACLVGTYHGLIGKLGKTWH